MSAGPSGCYPGTFDPPTVAHVAIARAAIEQCGLARLDLVLSEDAIGKPTPTRSTGERAAHLRGLFEAGVADARIEVRITSERLLVDIAAGYDVLVLGADKWAQVVDPRFYGASSAARDEAVAALPTTLACAPRPGFDVPRSTSDRRVVVLDLDRSLGEVSSSAIRAGNPDADRWIARRHR